MVQEGIIIVEKDQGFLVFIVRKNLISVKREKSQKVGFFVLH
jgi:hypothetical protein